MNILESLLQLTNQPTVLPHLGEAYGIWFYYTLASSGLSFCQLAANHARDPGLKEAIEEIIHDLEEPQLKKLGDLLTREGIAFPVDFPRHPKADPDAIPPGARMNDIEIANLLALKLEAMLTTGHANLQQTLREDIGVLYMAFTSELMAHSFKLKKLMQNRGWIVMPPPYQPAGVSHK